MERALREKTDVSCEVRRLTLANEQLDKNLQDAKISSLRVQGDSHSSSATANRLQTQLTGKQTDIEVLLRSKEELEKIIKATKTDALESERKASDYYQQLLRATENF